jgi:stalled ribosome rescue protein Dom34
VSSSRQTQASPAHSRAVVWIDHLTARVFSMGLTGVTPIIVHAHLSSPHLHHKANAIGDGRVEEDPNFLEQVAKTVAPCREILILGPGMEKAALQHYLQSAYPQMMLRLETSDHPTDPEIIALGRKHFGLD